MKKVIILLTLIPLVLIAQPRPDHHPVSEQQMDLKGLDLTDVQKEKMHDLRIAFKKESIKVKTEMELSHIELHELIFDDVTGKKLDIAINKVADLKSKIFKMQINNKIAMRNILNDEQKEKMKQFKMMKNGFREGRRSNRNFYNYKGSDKHFFRHGCKESPHEYRHHN